MRAKLRAKPLYFHHFCWTTIDKYRPLSQLEKPIEVLERPIEKAAKVVRVPPSAPYLVFPIQVHAQHQYSMNFKIRAISRPAFSHELSNLTGYYLNYPGSML